MPRQWWPDIESANAVIESEEPWPSSSPQSNGIFVPLDVDTHEGFAVVVGFGPARHGRDVIGFDEFEQTDTGLWDRRAGGGKEGQDLGERVEPRRWERSVTPSLVRRHRLVRI